MATVWEEAPRGGEAGDILVVYARDTAGAIARVIVAAGDDVVRTLEDADR